MAAASRQEHLAEGSVVAELMAPCHVSVSQQFLNPVPFEGGMLRK